MAKLRRRERLLPAKREDGSERHGLLRGFHAKQRERKVLKATAKPQHGVSQPMPPRAK